jgi:hypothetical protein
MGPNLRANGGGAMLQETALWYRHESSWFTDSFQQYSIAWLLISAFVGAVVGSTSRFLFEDVLRPRLGLKRDARRLLSTFTAPLMRSADTLERQINNVVRNAEKNWYCTSEYYQLSTLFTFGEYLAWVKLIERKFGFVVLEYSRAGRRVDQRLNGFFGAMSSFRYFRRWADPAAVERSAVPRRMFTAMGEVMLAPMDGGEPTVMEFSDFCVRYVNDEQFQRWFGALDAFLRAVADDDYRWDRLLLAGANLRALVAELDPSGRVGATRYVANLEDLRHDELRREAVSEFAHLLEPRRQTKPATTSPSP